MSFVESNRYCKSREANLFFKIKKLESSESCFVELEVSHLEADRAVVMHCSFDTVVGILQDIAVATPCSRIGKKGIRSAS